MQPQVYINFIFAMTHFSPIPKKLEIAGVRFSICNKRTRIEVVFLAESLVFNQFTLRFYCWKFIFDKNCCFLIFILEWGCYNHKFLRGLGLLAGLLCIVSNHFPMKLQIWLMMKECDLSFSTVSPKSTSKFRTPSVFWVIGSE